MTGPGRSPSLAASGTGRSSPRCRPHGVAPPLLASGDFFGDEIPEAVAVTQDGGVIFLTLEGDGSASNGRWRTCRTWGRASSAQRTSPWRMSTGTGCSTRPHDRGSRSRQESGSCSVSGSGCSPWRSTWASAAFRDLIFGDFDGDGVRRSRPRARDVRGRGLPRHRARALRDADGREPDAGVRDLSAADLSGDGMGDLVAMSSSALHVARGDRGGGTSRRSRSSSPGERSRASPRRTSTATDGRPGPQRPGGEPPPRGLPRAGRHGHPRAGARALELPGQVRAADLDGDPHLDSGTETCRSSRCSWALRAELLPPEGGESTSTSGRADGDRGGGPRRRAETVDVVASTRTGLRPAPRRRAGRSPSSPSCPSWRIRRSSAPETWTETARSTSSGGTGHADVVGRGRSPRPGADLLEAGRADPRDLELFDREGDGLLEARRPARAHPRDWAALGQGGSGPRALRGRLGARSLVVADIDGDGRLDCVTGEYAARRLPVFRGATQPRDRFRRGDVDSSGDAQPHRRGASLGPSSSAAVPRVPRRGGHERLGDIDLTDPVFLLRHLFSGARLRRRRAGGPAAGQDAGRARDVPARVPVRMASG